LALGKPFDKISLLSTFEDTGDSISNFYNNKGYKRKAHLRATALYMRLDLSKITYIFKELWISSEFTAIQHIKKSWLALVVDLDAIASDPEFNDISRAKAKGLRMKLLDRFFIELLHFLLDLLKSLSIFSKALQRETGLLIGKQIIRDKIISLADDLKNKNGVELESFYKEIECFGPDNMPIFPCTADFYGSAFKVTWKDQKLLKSKNKLTDIRNSFINSVN